MFTACQIHRFAAKGFHGSRLKARKGSAFRSHRGGQAVIVGLISITAQSNQGGLTNWPAWPNGGFCTVSGSTLIPAGHEEVPLAQARSSFTPATAETWRLHNNEDQGHRLHRVKTLMKRMCQLAQVRKVGSSCPLIFARAYNSSADTYEARNGSSRSDRQAAIQAKTQANRTKHAAHVPDEV